MKRRERAIHGLGILVGQETYLISFHPLSCCDSSPLANLCILVWGDKYIALDGHIPQNIKGLTPSGGWLTTNVRPVDWEPFIYAAYFYMKQIDSVFSVKYGQFTTRLHKH